MIRLLIALLLIASPALAQQQSTALDRVSGSYGQCVGTAERLVDQVGDLQRQIAAQHADLAKANARIKELEPKPADRPAE